MKRKIIPYNTKLKELARQLRNNSTISEIKLWQQLKGKQMLGYDFHRQKPLLNFIADFYCYELQLVIELDGYSHQFEEVQIKDAFKQNQLEELGLTVLRFQDKDVLRDMNNVMRGIKNYIEVFEEHTPTPLKRGATN
jgi:very-short-patch-repair endonuclease